MRPRKKPYGNEQPVTNSLKDNNHNQVDKENIYLRLRKRRSNIKKEQNSQNLKLNSDEEFEKLLLSSQHQDFKLKPQKFWAKKLKDLESQKIDPKKKRHGLYEFSETDESQSSFKIKKFQRPPASQKRKTTRTQKPVKRLKKLTKKVTTDSNSTSQKATQKNKEDECLPPLDWLTSTPANVGTRKPKFLCLSPIEVEENIQCSKVTNEENDNFSFHNNCFDKKTPKKPTPHHQPPSGRRILRSRQLII